MARGDIMEETSRWRWLLPTKADHFSLIPDSDVVEHENWFPSIYLGTCTHIHRIIFFFNFRDNNIIVNRLILVNRNFFKNTCLPFLSSVGWCMFLIQLLGGRSRQVWVQPGLPTKFQGNQDYGEKLWHHQFPPTPLSKIIFYFL